LTFSFASRAASFIFSQACSAWPFDLLGRVGDLILGAISPLLDLALGTPYRLIHFSFCTTLIHNSTTLD
jgi:hypothetical protein